MGSASKPKPIYHRYFCVGGNDGRDYRSRLITDINKNFTNFRYRCKAVLQ